MGGTRAQRRVPLIQELAALHPGPLDTRLAGPRKLHAETRLGRPRWTAFPRGTHLRTTHCLPPAHSPCAPSTGSPRLSSSAPGCSAPSFTPPTPHTAPAVTPPTTPPCRGASRTTRPSPSSSLTTPVPSSRASSSRARSSTSTSSRGCWRPTARAACCARGGRAGIPGRGRS